jgi:hypothetical protein
MTVFKIAAGIVMIALAAGLWFRGEHYAARARTSEALLSSALAIGNANAEVVRTQAERARTIDAVTAVNAIRKRDLRTRSDTRRKDIIHAAPEADGPLAPVLRDQLDRLPERPSANASRNSTAAAHPGGPAATH